MINLFPDTDAIEKSILLYDFAPRSREFSSQEWHRASHRLVHQQLAGVALRSIREQSLSVPNDVLEELQLAHFHAMERTVSALHKSREALDLLIARGIVGVIIKGPSIAQLYRYKTDRPYVDIDFIVSPPDFKRALALLATIGYEEASSSRPQRSYFSTRCREAINLRDGHGGSIDLHHHVAPWLWSTNLTANAMRAHQVDCPSDRSPVAMASPEHNLLVAALHLVSDHGRPGATHRIWRDLLVIYQHCSDDILLAAARQAHLISWLKWVLQCLPLEVRPVEFVERLSNETDDLHSIWRMKILLSKRMVDSPHVSQMFRLPTSSSLLYLVGMAVPSETFLRYHYSKSSHPYFSWWRECSRELNGFLNRRQSGSDVGSVEGVGR